MNIPFNKIMLEVARAIDREMGEEHDRDAMESEQLAKLLLLFKSCQFVIMADGKTSIAETLFLGDIMNECRKYVSEENIEYIISLLKSVTEDDIKKEIEKHNYSEEYLYDVIQLCIKIAHLGGLTVEEKLIIEELKHIFGL